MRCAIVDDCGRFVESARRVLEQQGISVVGVASNSAEAIRLVAECRPEVTLVDIVLGGESGFDLIDDVERSGLADHMIMICVSTYAADDFAETVADSAAVAFVTKNELCGDIIREIWRSNRHQGADIEADGDSEAIG